MTRINGSGRHRAERHYAATVKIRYRDPNKLSPGLHATAERHGHTITVYLLPGLTAEERAAALRRLRLSGRMGYGPRLPAVQLAFALFADRIRTTIAQAGSVFRTHPAGTTGPVMLISGGAIAFLALSALSIHILREPRGPHGSSASGPAPAASAIAVRIPGSPQRLADGPAGSQGGVLTAARSRSDPLPVPISANPPGTGSGAGPGTGSTGPGSVRGTGSTSTGTVSTGIGSGARGGGTTAASGAGSTPNLAPSTSVSASVPASASAPVSVPVAAPVSAPVGLPRSVTASVAPSLSVSASDLPSVSASVPASVSASVSASVYTSDPVTVSASASLPVQVP